MITGWYDLPIRVFGVHIIFRTQLGGGKEYSKFCLDSCWVFLMAGSCGNYDFYLDSYWVFWMVDSSECGCIPQCMVRCYCPGHQI